MRLLTKMNVLLVAAVLSLASALSSIEFDERINGILGSEDTDGFDIATLHAVDPASNEETRQTRSDIEAHAGSSVDKRTYALTLSSGERLRMSVQRRSIDFSGAVFTEITEDGERQSIDIDPSDCFFSGEIQNREGFASLSLCDGELIGSITTPTRSYQLHTLPSASQDSGSGSDDDMQILVTWQDHNDDVEEDMDENDGLEIPEDSSSSVEMDTERRSVTDHSGTVEICDVVDQYFVADIKRKLGITNSSKIIQLLISKWSSAAHMLSNVTQVGWKLNLRLVKVDIMRSHPEWYLAKPQEKMGARLNEICKPTRRWKCDQISLHTGQTSDRKIVGLAWVGGLCMSQHRCSALRSSNTNYMAELHELGHNLGLKHDNKERRCINGSDSVHGFMGGNRHHFRQCYRDVLARSLPKKRCIFSNVVTNTSDIVMDFSD